MNSIIPRVLQSFIHSDKFRSRLGMGQMGLIMRTRGQSVAVCVVKMRALAGMTGTGCMRAGRKTTPYTLDVHSLGEKEDTRKADADEGNGDLRAKPHGGCGHRVCSRLDACHLVQLKCQCVSYKLGPFGVCCSLVWW